MADKLFVPVIYIKDGAASVSAEDVHTILDTDPVRLALSYAENGADAILASDLSTTDREHEETLGLIQQICASVNIPVYGQGHIRRMEDVKKLLYAGCRKAVLDFDRIDHETMYREVADKFGADRIIASISATRLSRSSILKVEDAGSWIMLREDAAIAYLRAPSPEKFFGSIPLMIDLNTVNLEQILDLFEKNVIALTGNCVNENSRNLDSIRQMLQNNGIAEEPFTAGSSIRFDDLKKGADQLVPVVVQEASTDEVLMVAYMDRTAYEETLRTGRMTYYSRSRKKLWVKGETSGHFQYLISLTADCDLDTLLARVKQIGPACHTGSHSCFFNTVFEDKDQEIHDPTTVLLDDYRTIIDRKNHPKEGSYTTYLFDKGLDKMLKKLGEENAEIIIAAKNPDNREIIYEIADYLYHMMVVMADQDVTWEDVFDELARRQNSEQSKE